MSDVKDEFGSDSEMRPEGELRPSSSSVRRSLWDEQPSLEEESIIPADPPRSLWDEQSSLEEERDAPADPPSVAHRPSSPRKKKGRRFAWLRQGLIGLAVLVILALVFSLVPMLRQKEVVALQLEGRLALLPLVNETGSEAYDWMAEGWTEMVVQSLSRTPGVEVIPPQRLAREVKVRGLARDQEAVRERVRALAFSMGADVVFDGVIRRRNARQGELRPLSGDGEPSLRLEFRLLSADGATVASSEILGDDPIELANVLVVSLARGLSGDGEPVRLERVYSNHLFLDQLYGLGLAALRRQELDRAEHIFELVLQQEPRFLYAGLSLLETRLAGRTCHVASTAASSRDASSRDAASRDAASSVGGGVSQLDSALREDGRDSMTCRDLAQQLLERSQAQAERRVESAVLMFLARLEALAGRGPAAQELLSQARSVLPEDAANEHLQVDQELARLALVQNERDEAKVLFDQQLIAERTAGNVLAQASVLLELGSLELARGDLEAARGALEEALHLAREQTDPWLEARSMSSLGEVARQQGENAQAIRLWQEALVFYRQPEDGPRRLLLLQNLAELALKDRRFEEAEDDLFAVRDLAAELGLRQSEAAASLRLAWVMLRTGYPRQAREHLDHTLELDRWITDERLALQLVIAWFAYEEGNYRLAVETQEDARRNAGDAWRSVDDAFLSSYRQALASGVRVPVPGENEPQEAATPVDPAES